MQSFLKRILPAFLAGLFLLSAQNISGFEEGDKLLRIRGMWAFPNDNSGATTGALTPGTIEVGSELTPEIDGTYMLTKEIGLELVATATRHNFSGKGALAGTEVGHTWMIPATLLAQWHFHFSDHMIPYIGVGVNFAFFFDETNYLAGQTGMSLKSSWGLAGQIGMDYMLSDNDFINFDVKYIDIDTTATLSGATAGTMKIDINPWLFSVGLGHRF